MPHDATSQIELNVDRTPVLHIMTSALTISFLANHLKRIEAEPVDYHVAANFTDTRFDADTPRFHQLDLTRKLIGAGDLGAIWQMIRVLWQVNPRIIIVSTPKAAFLGSLVALLMFPFRRRIVLIRGYRYPTLTGLRRKLVKFMEVLPAVISTEVLVTSKQSGEMLNESLPSMFHDKVKVVLNGTGNGIDIDRFSPENPEIADSDDVRARLGASKDGFVLGMVGRVCVDKGFEELVAAMEIVRAKHPNIELLVIGEDDASDPLMPETLAKLNQMAIRPGRIENNLMPEVYGAFDVLLFPSRREGFGVAAIEAAAMGTPTIASRIGGLQSAVKEGVTGVFFEPGSAEDLARAICAMYEDQKVFGDLCETCRPHAVSHYDERLYDAFWIDIYLDRRPA